ncbi:MAG: type II secretion system protein [Halomonadaceae bacterium]|nr:MAG: type II secretion system protein [Halomonadaceae bacterium]
MAKRDVHRGFSLIELILVIIVMALAMSILIPRLGDISDDARQVKLQQVASSYSTALALVRAQWVAQNTSGPMENLPGFGRGDINVSQHGWAVSVNGATDPEKLRQQDCVDLWYGLLQSNAPRIALREGDGAPFTAFLENNRCYYRFSGNPDFYFHYTPENGELVTFLNQNVSGER